MAMNLTRISTDSGIEYLLQTVTNGDAEIGKNGFIDYYTATGTPVGRWVGRGVEGMGLKENSPVNPSQAQALFQAFKNPVTGQRMGAKPGLKESVAGFDLTFTLPKSVSVLWAMADRETQQQIMAAHEQAMADTLSWLEKEAFQTRAGKAGVAIHETRGVTAARYHHWDTRDGDPHLHTHMVVANRVQRATDGKWVTLDSRALYKAAVAASEVHTNYLLDELTRSMGIEFVESDTSSRAVVMDIDGIPSELTRLFSGRTSNIEPLYQKAIEQWTSTHGAKPTGKTLAQIKQNIWRQTRQPKDKTPQTLNDLVAKWKRQAGALGINLEEMVHGALHRVQQTDVITSTTTNERIVDSATDLMVQGRSDEIAQDIVGLVQKTKATWTIANLRAEAERATRAVRCDSPKDRDALLAAIVDRATELSVELSSSARYDLSSVLDPDQQFLAHGRSIFDDEHSRVFTSQHVLDTEQFLLGAATSAGPQIDPETAHTLLQAASEVQMHERGFGFAADQLQAAFEVLSHGKALSGIIGPAGTGKTTTMAAIKAVWEDRFGQGAVIGLTTSAQAASVLEQEIGTSSHTVAKWLYESVGEGAQRRSEELRALESGEGHRFIPRSPHARRRRALKLIAQQERWKIQPGQLVILDEASMTGTLDLATITEQVQRAGAKILLVGDPAQLGAIDAGGFLGMLERGGHTSSLTSVWRFTNDWEKQASLSLRAGTPDVLNEYSHQDRIAHGTTEDMLEQAYGAARADQLAGKSTILIAATNEAVKDLNTRFMYERRVYGEVDAENVIELRDGLDAGIGEFLLARKVDRGMIDSAGDFLKNGTQLTVENITATHITARRSDNDATISIPRQWAKQHMELGYAITGHRAQGTTVDTGHVVIPEDSAMVRELLYVAMTRGRQSNRAWVGEALPDPAIKDISSSYVPLTWKDTLTRILNTSGQELTALEQGTAWDDTYFGLDRLMQERSYVRSLLGEELGRQHLDAARTKIREAYGVETAQMICDSPSFTSLSGYLHRNHTTVEEITQACPPWRVRDTENPLKEVAYHLKRVLGDRDTENAALAGSETLAAYLEKNQRLQEMRASVLSERATSEKWFQALPLHTQQDTKLIAKIASYREAFHWHGDAPLGPEPSPIASDQYAAWGTVLKQLVSSTRAANGRHASPLTTPQSTIPSQPQAPGL